VINSYRIIGAANAERWEGAFMQFTGQRVISLDQGETDSVTTWILTLAIGMIVLGAMFAVLDWCDLLPPLLAAEDFPLNSRDRDQRDVGWRWGRSSLGYGGTNSVAMRLLRQACRSRELRHIR
jgi:hypothetical protein